MYYCICAKIYKDFPSLGSNTRALTERQTDGTETITLPAKAGGNDFFFMVK